MSFVDKFKKILFDDVEEDVLPGDELPERSPKAKKEEKKETTGFIEYHHEEEDTITELKLPKEEEVQEQVEKKPNFNFPQDVDYEAEVQTPQMRTRSFDAFDMDFMSEDDDNLVKAVDSFNVKNLEREDKKVQREIRDYRKMLNNNEEEVHEKKPFTNTPVISPVWGILDKNYKPEEIVDRTEALTKVNTGVVSPRSFGPVSYNDQPLVQRKPKVKVEKSEDIPSLKEELVELNTTISDLINESVEEIEEVAASEDIYNQEEIADIEASIQEEAQPQHSIEDVVIKTDDYDNYDDIASNIENEINGIEHDEDVNTNIEDAFESTSEFDSIVESDAIPQVAEVEEVPDEEEDELVDLESIVNKKPDDEDDSGLDNTIETDLFNLIDSMYKDNEDE